MSPIADSKADQDKKLFVGGLSPLTNEDSLRNYYSQWGDITDVVVMKDPKSHKSRGFGFVTFKESTSVDNAQSNRPHKIDGKDVDSKRAMPREETSPEVHAAVKKIFVGGLKKDVNNEDLVSHFGTFGSVVDAQVVRNKESNASRGFGFVTFDDTDSVDKVILARPHSISGHNIDVRKALSKEEMIKARGKPPPARVEYNSTNNQGWNDAPQMGYQQQQQWDQGYSQTYGQQQQYGYNNPSYGYGGHENSAASGWSNVSDGFGNYYQQSYSGGPMRTATPSQYSRPAPYTGNGWQQR